MEDNKDTNVVDNEVAKDEATKTYTKEDIDNSFNAGVKKASTEWQKDEKYKEFLAWKKTNQSDSEKIASLELDKSSLANQVKSLEAQLKVSGSDVKKEFSKFVTSEVMGLVNDTTDFDTALKNSCIANIAITAKHISTIYLFPNVSINTTKGNPNIIDVTLFISISSPFFF